MDARSRPFRYSLRTLFCIMAGVAVLSALLRSVVRGDPTFVLGIGSFCYGGIVAIPCYAFFGSLVVLSAKTTWGERAGDVFAGLVGAVAWIAFVIGALHPWPQLCVVYSLGALGGMGLIVWWGWEADSGPSPEATLHQLLIAKKKSAQDLRDGTKTFRSPDE